VADIDEAGREDLREKAAEEFFGMERGRATVLGAERHGVARDGDLACPDGVAVFAAGC